ncbi:toxin-activating lysine-acyltransferase [Rhodophyticola sp. CCM32]|uniref:toxin-activating lysine-acyltransferase n=1 Tax=Rhodophyticola sp. CCM32 TaxID=2916397 RepID=UPI00107F84C7|nr:toxin-activating lysine-acyltransferase [Rhodophyticola sp. CCM32]QBY02435.1 toxin-activating lysine-acyltransferase [Rhodophyticola sp. CCM32]
MSTATASDHFFRATMRHFAELRSSGPDQGTSQIPFPKDWFDLPQDVLADFGALVFLASLTDYHRLRQLSDLFTSFEPPLRLGQYKVFRSNGYPRAVITWAGLGPEQEYGFAVDHKPLRPEDWNSGTSPWLIDFIAPFGHIDQIVPHLTENPDLLHVRTLWHNKPGTRYRIVEWSRPAGEAEVRVKSYGVGQFKRFLNGGGDGHTP